MKTLNITNSLAEEGSPNRILLNYIPYGEASAISMNKLAEVFGGNTRIVRNKIEIARREGNIIASSQKGYFIPINIEELEAYYKTSKARITASQRCLEPVENLLKMEGVKL